MNKKHEFVMENLPKDAQQLFAMFHPNFQTSVVAIAQAAYDLAAEEREVAQINIEETKDFFRRAYLKGRQDMATDLSTVFKTGPERKYVSHVVDELLAAFSKNISADITTEQPEPQVTDLEPEDEEIDAIDSNFAEKELQEATPEPDEVPQTAENGFFEKESDQNEPEPSSDDKPDRMAMLSECEIDVYNTLKERFVLSLDGLREELSEDNEPLYEFGDIIDAVNSLKNQHFVRRFFGQFAYLPVIDIGDEKEFFELDPSERLTVMIKAAGVRGLSIPDLDVLKEAYPLDLTKNQITTRMKKFKDNYIEHKRLGVLYYIDPQFKSALEAEIKAAEAASKVEAASETSPVKPEETTEADSSNSEPSPEQETVSKPSAKQSAYASLGLNPKEEEVMDILSLEGAQSYNQLKDAMRGDSKTMRYVQTLVDMGLVKNNYGKFCIIEKETA